MPSSQEHRQNNIVSRYFYACAWMATVGATRLTGPGVSVTADRRGERPMHMISDLKLVAAVGLGVAAFAVVLWLLTLTRPKPQTQPEGPAGFMHLVPGRTYRVLRPFTDFDGVIHPEGETWLFKGYDFLPYDDGLTLWIEPGSLRLQWRPEAQGEIINALAEYVGPDGN
jgi:hypothetical protein